MHQAHIKLIFPFLIQSHLLSLKHDLWSEEQPPQLEIFALSISEIDVQLAVLSDLDNIRPGFFVSLVGESEFQTHLDDLVGLQVEESLRAFG